MDTEVGRLRGFAQGTLQAFLTAVIVLTLAFGLARLVGDKVEDETAQTSRRTQYLVCDVIVNLHLEVSEDAAAFCADLLTRDVLP